MYTYVARNSQCSKTSLVRCMLEEKKKKKFKLNRLSKLYKKKTLEKKGSKLHYTGTHKYRLSAQWLCQAVRVVRTLGLVAYGTQNYVPDQDSTKPFWNGHQCTWPS